jgi:TatD DNase family protein
MYQVIDSHAHLEELEHLKSAIERAKESGVIAIIAVGSEYESNHKVLEIAEEYKSFVYPALGLHPWSLGTSASDWEHNLQFIESNIENIVAIGEIGLDYHKELLKSASKGLQQSMLKNVLRLAQRYGKPAIIHSRYAWRDTLTLAKDIGVKKAVFHWYTGPLNVLRDILAQGYFASATLAAEYHEEHRRAIKEAPLGRLLLETDSPAVYRAGTEFEHQSEPADVIRTLEAVTKLKDIEPSVVASKTTENVLRLYRISKI